MPQPRILFPVPIWLQSLNRGSTVYDEELREAVQTETYCPTITISGQVMWTFSERLSMNASGATEQADGYIIFSYPDLRYRNLELKREDRIIKIGRDLCDLYIVGLQPIAHYPDLGGAGLLKAMFRDKQNSRNSPGV